MKQVFACEMLQPILSQLTIHNSSFVAAKAQGMHQCKSCTL